MKRTSTTLFALLSLGSLAQAQQTTAQTTQAPQRTGSTRVTWRTRTLVGDQRLLQWRTGPSSKAFPNLTFLEAATQADLLGLNSIEGSSAQKVSTTNTKNLDHALTAEEQAAVRDSLKTLNVRMVGYRVDTLPGDEAKLRKVLEFAKAMGADTVIGSAGTASLQTLDKVASELEMNVALEGRTGLVGLEGLSNRVGLAIDASTAKLQASLKGRVHVVNLRGGGSTPLFLEMNRLGLTPLLLTLNATSPGGMWQTVDAFEKAVQPALGAFVVAASKSMPIRGGDTLPAEMRAQIDAAIPRSAYAQPKKPRKLLVIDACVANMSHNTIPHFNYAIEMMAKHTGAFTPVFSNDLDNLRWPKIKEFDAIYLNDTVGELFPDSEIRESLLRYVREGGGIGGWHGSPWASRSWRELGDMMAAMDAPHRIEPAYIRLDDPKSPINQAFDGTGLQHTEEYYRFNHTGPTGGFYSRDKVHVLLSLDTAKSPEIFKPGRDGKPFFTRPDNDYAVAWIRSYGKGRVFYNSMGHMPATMTSKPIMGHVFAAIQFLLGDLEADTTPSAKLAASK